MAEELQVVQGEALVALQRAETETLVDIANRFPRKLEKCKEKFLALAACDEETARSCFYRKPVDNNGTMAEGPSIRLAEIAVNSYGNIRYGTRVIEESEKWITVQGFCFDMESNLFHASEIKRSIYSERNKKRYSQNMIEVTMKAAAAIALRDAVFKVVPLGFFSSELKKIKAKATGRGSDIPLAQRIQNAFTYFTKLGVSEERILETLEIHGKDEIGEDHLETLVGLRTAIETHETTVEEAFPGRKKEQAEQKAEQLAQDMKGLKPEKVGTDAAQKAAIVAENLSADKPKGKGPNQGKLL